MSLKAWILDVVACPMCGGRLAAQAGGVWLECRSCALPYPVLDGVPVLVPRPAAWMASYREAVLATLAEHGAASRAAVKLVNDVAAAGGAGGETDAMAFGDDWAAGETEGPPPAPAGGSDAARGFAAWLAETGARGPERVVLAMLPERAGTVVELGAGAGRLGPALAKRGEQMITADLSLRAVLRARAKLPAARAAGVVMDAEQPALRAGAVDVLVAAALVDLLERPEAFLGAAAAALAARGVAVVTTPEPALGSSDDGWLGAAARQAGFAGVEVSDGVPWIRSHGPRYYQVYFAQVVRLTKKKGGKNK